MSDALHNAHEKLTRAITGEHDEDPDDPATVQAMQVVLHLPKQDLPPRHEVLSAATRAAVMVCLDERAATDEHYRVALADWYDHRIRKVTRRARASGWERAQRLIGVTATTGAAQARAFVPGRVDAVPHDLSRLQIKGTDLPEDNPPSPEHSAALVLINADLEMTAGKAAAQAGHAAMLLAAHLDLKNVRTWAQANYPLCVREVPGEIFDQACGLTGAVTVEDGGFTEVAPGTVTAVAFAHPPDQLSLT